MRKNNVHVSYTWYKSLKETEHGKLALAEVKQPTSSNMYDLPYFIIGNKKKLNLVVPSWVRALQPIQQCNAGPWGYLPSYSYTLLVRALKGVPANQWGMKWVWTIKKLCIAKGAHLDNTAWCRQKKEVILCVSFTVGD